MSVTILHPVGVSFWSPHLGHGHPPFHSQREARPPDLHRVPRRGPAPAQLLRTWGIARSLLGEPLEGSGHGGRKAGCAGSAPALAFPLPPPALPLPAQPSLFAPACGLACSYI